MSGINKNSAAAAGQRLEQLLQGISHHPQSSARLAFGANVLLIVLIAYSAARLTWQWAYTPQTEVSRSPLTQQATTRQQAGTATPLQGIAALHLFGQANTRQVKKTSVTPISAPETRLRLILHGAFASTNPDDSIAIIAEKGKKDKIYRNGDALPSGATLHQIYADRVILSRNGKLETLRMVRRRADAGISKSTALPARQADIVQPATRRVKDVRRLLKKDPTKLWQQIRITPVMNDGQIQGYHFNHNDPQLMRDLGLQPKDVITAINGTSVKDMGSVMKIMNGIDDMRELNLDIMRHGVPKTINIKLN